MVELSVIVLCYHGDRWLGPCMDSLENQSLERNRYEIILLDNGGSTPATQSYKEHEQVKVVGLEKNLGFAGGNNHALAYARGDIVVLMNQDIEVHSRCLQAILESFASSPEAGVVSTNMHMVCTGSDFDLHGAVPETAGSFRLTRMGYAQYEISKPQPELVPIQFASGNGLSFRKSVLKDVGNYLFDSRLGSYGEDLDFSIRINRSSWRMVMNPQAVIFHYRDDAFAGSPRKAIEKFSHISSNRLLVHYKHLWPGRFLTELPLLAAGIPFKVGRLDGESQFNWRRFSAGFLATPFVLLLFIKRALSFKKMPPDRESKK